MLDYRYTFDKKTGEKYCQTSLIGKALLSTTQLNKGTAFSEAERHEFGLLGKLPYKIETLEEQVARVYAQYKHYETNLQKNIYLNNLHDRNQVLFYKLVLSHLSEMLPVIYTPIVGMAVKKYSLEFRTPRGLYISYPEREHIQKILTSRSNPDVKLIVVSDGEGILGIGDQGVGGMDIPVAKLMVYTLCGGIPPFNTLPIFLDTGTNNQELLDDPFYLGWRHPRIEGKLYDEFIDNFIAAVKHHFPSVYLHWEDFGRINARNNLERFRKAICSFNDDIQGTGVVTLAAILAGVKATGAKMADQRVVVFGAGSAGTGVSRQIREAMIREGLSTHEASTRFWLLNRTGLISDYNPASMDETLPYQRPANEVDTWNTHLKNKISLLEVIHNVKPTILIGTSTSKGAFTQEIIEAMAKYNEHPIVLPLSNPTALSEAEPQDIMNWSNHKAFVATGSPFPPVTIDGRDVRIAQCNNALAFPGIGIGVLAAQASEVTDNMLWAACQSLSAYNSPDELYSIPVLLPSIEDSRAISREIAIAVVQQAITDGVAHLEANADIQHVVDELIWEPHYVPFKRT